MVSSSSYPSGSFRHVRSIEYAWNIIFHRFQLAGDLTDISESILYQQKALCLTPEA